jgi:multidrug efflux system outer membrane protein
MNNKKNHAMKRSPFYLVPLAALLTAACMTPQYNKPVAPIPANFPIAQTDSGPAAVDIGWRAFFKNPELQEVIATALANNRDLKTITLQVEEARALYDIQSADRLLTSSTPINRTVYQVGVSVTAFELDLFNRVKNLSAAALAQFMATEEARRSAQILLVGEVSKSWLTERTLYEQVQLAIRTLEGRQASFDLVKKRFDAGITNALELRQSDTLVQSARVSLLALKRQHALSVNALQVLVGTQIQSSASMQSLAKQETLATIGAGLPSELLTQRPDIRAAEQRLRAMQANIAAARAAFFPRIALTAGVGTASTDLSGLFNSGQNTWSFVPSVSLPIFDAGRNKANLKVAEVRSEIAVASYEKTIQVAFREVADALAARATLNDEADAQQAVQKSQSERLVLAQARYQNGIANYLEVLDAERELFTAEQQLLQTKLLNLTNAIDLYRALGGGIQEMSK